MSTGLVSKLKLAFYHKLCGRIQDNINLPQYIDVGDALVKVKHHPMTVTSNTIEFNKLGVLMEGGMLVPWMRVKVETQPIRYWSKIAQLNLCAQILVGRRRTLVPLYRVPTAASE